MEQARGNPGGLSFKDFETLMAGKGWTFRRQKGSHRLWYSPSGHRLPVQPKGRSAKDYRSRSSLRSMTGRIPVAKRRHDRFDGYGVQLFIDDDGDWMAHVVELPNVSAFGPTMEKALNELAVAWELVKESYREDQQEIPVAPSKRQYSGQFNVRIDKRVHRALAIEAARAGLTLNALVAQKLAQSVAE
jgi:predicted HicB family RNase H-like nuclease/predicted RNA binding protein YcfA (HicA-like mRNA interferase family)